MSLPPTPPGRPERTGRPHPSCPLSRGRERGRRKLAALVAIACLWTASAWAQEPLRRVGVGFLAEAPGFQFALDHAQKTAVDRVIDKLGKTFGFVEWVPVTEADQDFDARWIVRLHQKGITLQASPENAVDGWQIRLEHHVSVGGQPFFELPQLDPRPVLYDLGDVPPFQNPTRLHDRLGKRLGEQLHDDFLESVETLFLRRITLAEKVVVEAEDPDSGRVVVPLRLSEIKATSDSLIGVRLKTNDQQYGTIVMKAASRVPDGELQGYVHGQIHTFEVPPIDDMSLPRWWDPRLPAVFSQAQTQEIYMHDYFLDLAAGTPTSGSISLTP